MSFEAPSSPKRLRTVEDRGVNLREIVAILKRRSRAFMVTAFCIVLAVTVYAYLAEPIFVATAQILLDPRSQRTLDNDGGQEQLPSEVMNAVVDSQVRVVESEAVLRRVVRAQNLIADSEFAGDGWLSSLWHRGRAVWGWTATGSEDVEGRVLRNLRQSIVPKRVEKTFVIEVSAASRERDKAARLSNATAEALLADHSEARSAATRRAASALEARLSDLKEQVKRSEDAVEAYKFEHNTVVASTPFGRNEALVGLRELERKAEASRAVYQAFLIRERTVAEQANLDRTEARIITHGTPPERQSWPRPGIMVVAALFLGAGLGAGVALARDHFDTRLYTKAQVEESSHWPVLSVIPRLRLTTAGIARNGQGAFLRLLDAIHNTRMHPIKIVLITSSQIGEGKSTIAVNLAAVAAKEGERVLLVDSPYVKPATAPASVDVSPQGSAQSVRGANSNQVSRSRFGSSAAESDRRSDSNGQAPGGASGHPNSVPNDPTLAHAKNLDLHGSNFFVLPAGVLKRESPVYDQLFELLTGSTDSFDLIIIECGAASDDWLLRDMAHVADAIIIVAQAGRTRFAHIEDASELLGVAAQRIVGIVLNRPSAKAGRT
jgi:Mrp family chromosome partitioning ATPase